MTSNLMNYFNCVYDESKRIWESNTVKTEFNENDSMGQVLFGCLKQTPNNVLQIDDTYGIKITNSQAISWSIRVALYLKKLNLNHKDIVGISCRNSTYLLPVVLGCFFSGVPFHPVNPDLDDDTTSHCYGLTKPTIIFCDGEIYEKIRRSTREHCQLIITVSEHINGVKNILDVLETNEEDEEVTSKPQKLVEGPTQTIAILCSSGTTGKPKAVCFSTPGLLSVNPLLTAETVVFLANGIDWYTGLWFLMNNCISGCTRIITKRLFDTDYFLHLVSKYQITYAFLSSRYVAKLVNHSQVNKKNLKSLKAIQFGGSNLSEATLKRFTALFEDNVVISFGYGITEIGAIAFNTDKSRMKSVGKLMPNLKLRIVNEKEENLGVGEVGEILLHSTVIWRGYYVNPWETVRSVDKDGWFHTGDLGFIDKDNFLYLVDRKKEILKYQGLHYWPTEIEHVIAELPDVMDVCVVSVFDEQNGDAAGALVVKKEKSSLTGEDVKQHVKQRLVASHKQINAGVYFVEQLPYNSNNKCVRNKARIILEALVTKY